MSDLATVEFVTQALAAGGITLSAAQETHLGAAIGAASKLIQLRCNRGFVRTTYDEVLTVEHDGTVMLREIPVNAVSRLAVDRDTALTVTNTDHTTNQRATVGFSTVGDVEVGLTATGLTLSRTAAGTTTTNTLLFATYTTLTALAAAINALGNGWSATVGSDFGGWPSNELIADDAPARGAFEGAELEVWSADDAIASFDRRQGIVQLFGRRRGTARVVYDAGFDAVPLPIQEATAEVVQDIFRTLASDPRIKSETIGDYSYDLNTDLNQFDLSAAVQGKIAPYRLDR